MRHYFSIGEQFLLLSPAGLFTPWEKERKGDPIMWRMISCFTGDRDGWQYPKERNANGATQSTSGGGPEAVVAVRLGQSESFGCLAWGCVDFSGGCGLG